MFAKCDSTRSRLLAPGIAVCLAYSGLFALPNGRKSDDLQAQSKQQVATIQKLSEQLVARRDDNQRQNNLLNTSTQSDLPGADELSTSSKAGASQHTLVGLVARMLETFTVHDIKCTSASVALDEDAPPASVEACTYRFLLVGSFPDFLLAQESVSALPQVVIQELTMERPASSNECRWTLTVQMEERP